MMSPLNDNVFPFDVAKLAQSLPECLAARGQGSYLLGILSETFLGCCASAR